MYFYELHEGDNEVFADLLLVHDEQWEPEEFFELVQQIRRRVQDTFEHDTLIEAIAAELERIHGFAYPSDERLVAAVNVSRDDDENFLAALDDEEDEDEDDPDASGLAINSDGDFRTVYAELDLGDRDRPN